jgi:peptidyl-prolyl cis-trans isomerase D
VNKLTSYLGGLAIVLVAVVFLIQFKPQTGNIKDTGPNCAAEVRGNCILASHFNAAYRLIIPPNADLTRLRTLSLRKVTADGLIERYLLNEDARRLGITVSDDDVTAELALGRARVSLPADKLREYSYSLGLPDDGVRLIRVKSAKTKKFDQKAYQKEIRTRTLMSPTDFRDFEREELVAARMRDLVRARVTVSEKEAHDRFVAAKSTSTIDYVRLDRHFYADLAVDPSKKAIDAWAEKSSAEVDKVWESRKPQVLPECRVARHIFVKLETAADDDAKKKARAKIDRALARVQKGEDFADVARAMSDDPTAVRGGELGCVPKGKMVKPFEDTAFATAAGKVSAVVESDAGYYIIKIEQIATGADAEKLGRAYAARDLYFNDEAERLTAEAAKQILAAVQGGKSLKDALDAQIALLPSRGEPKPADKKADDKKADDKKADDSADEDRPPLTAANHPNRPTIEVSLPFNLGGDPIPGARSGQQVAKTAFDLKKPGDAPNDVVPLETGYAVYVLKEKKPASQEEWDKERDNVLGTMRGEKENDALIGYLRRLRSSLGSEVKYTASLVDEPKAGKTEEPPPGEDPEE